MRLSLILRGILALAASVLTLRCAEFTALDLSDCKLVGEMPGPEDFDVDRTDPRKLRLIVSSQERRKVDPNGEMMEPGRIFFLSVTEGGPATAEAFVMRNRDELPFHPHGISVTKSGNETLLYVINHAAKTNHSIEVFQVKEKELVFKSRLRSPLLVHPNDLVALPDGQLYITNDHGRTGFLGFVEDLFGTAWSNVIHYRTGMWEEAASGFAFANGVQVNASGDRLYVAATRDKGIHVFKRDLTTGFVDRRALGFLDVKSGVDNLLWEDDQTLVVAAHPDLIAFLAHYRSAEKHSPSEVYRVRPVTGQIWRIYANDGRWIDAASTAVVLQGRLYVSQVFDPELLHCRMNR